MKRLRRATNYFFSFTLGTLATLASLGPAAALAAPAPGIFTLPSELHASQTKSHRDARARRGSSSTQKMLHVYTPFVKENAASNAVFSLLREGKSERELSLRPIEPRRLLSEPEVEEESTGTYGLRLDF